MSQQIRNGIWAGCLLVTSIWLSASMLPAQELDAEKAAARDYNIALAFQKKKLFEPAAVRWSTFIKTYPQDKRLANAHLNLGICQFGQENYSEAVTTFGEVLRKYPQFPDRDRVQFNLGMAHYNLAIQLEEAAKSNDAGEMQQVIKKFTTAAAEFAALPQQYPKSDQTAAARYYQAECLYLAGDKQTALSTYQQLISQHKESPFVADALYGVGTTLAEMDKQPEAVAAFQQFYKRFPQDARAGECRLREGMALHAQGKFGEAEKLFAELTREKDFPFADFALMRQAQAVQAQKKLSDAAALYELLPKKYPESEYAGSSLLAAGKCRFQGEQFPQAQNTFQQVLAKKFPEAAEAAYLLGRTLIQLKKPAEAVASLNQSIAAFPQSPFLPNLIFTRIEALAEQPTQREATVGQYAEFAAKYPQHDQAPDALYRAMFIAWESGKYGPARGYADKFLAVKTFANHPLKPEVLFLAAESRLLDEKPDVAGAEELYRRLLAEHPQSEKINNTQVRIGYCLYSQEKFDEAVTFLNPLTAGMKTPELKAESYLLTGRSHSEAGRIKESIPAFRAALNANPKWQREDEVLYVLGRSLRLNNEAQAAGQEFDKLVKQFPQSEFLDRCYYQLGEIELAGGKLDQAIAYYQKVVTGFPESGTAPLALYGIGLSQFQKGDWKNSVQELNTLLLKYPQHEISLSGLYLRGRSHFELQDYLNAIADLSKFLDRKPIPEIAAVARHTLGKSFAAQKKFEQAVTAYTTLLKEQPEYPQADSLHYDLAFAYLDGGQAKQATETFQALVSKHPASPLAAESWFRLGELRNNADQPAEVVQAYTAGLQLAKAPDLREKLFHSLGWVQFQQQKYAEAAAAFQSQLKEFPQGDLAVEGNYFAGESLYKQAKFDESLPLYDKVVQAKAPKFHANALYRSGDCAAGLKQWKQSEDFYQTLLTTYPKFTNLNEARYGLGLARQMQNQLDAAKKVYAEVVQATTSPTAAKSKYMMGECAFAQKNYQEASEHFLEVTGGYPDKDGYREWLSKSHFEAGRCFSQLKKFELARQELNTVVRKYADFPEAKNAKTLLDKLN